MHPNILVSAPTHKVYKRSCAVLEFAYWPREVVFYNTQSPRPPKSWQQKSASHLSELIQTEILTAQAPEAAETLSREIVAFVQHLRTEDLFKKPGVAETIDWAKCLLALDVIALSPEAIADTLGAILKYQDDISKLHGSEAKRILDQAKASLEQSQ